MNGARELRLPYVAARTGRGESVVRPLIPVTLRLGGRSVEAVGLVDSGADVSVLPHHLGLQLGADWSDHLPAVKLSGNMAASDARGIVLEAEVRDLGLVPLAFAWTQDRSVPLILGQVNFFAEFDVCFHHSSGFISLRRSRPAAE